MKKIKKVDNVETAQVESTYKTLITFTCPVRGKVTEEVIVKRYKPQKAPENKQVEFAISELFGDETLEDLEKSGFHEDKGE